MSHQEKRLAKIEHIGIAIEERGGLCFSAVFDYGGSGQGTGHYPLSNPKAGEFLQTILEVIGTTDFQKAVGRTVYALRHSDDFNAPIIGIESLPFDTGKRILFADFYVGLGHE